MSTEPVAWGAAVGEYVTAMRAAGRSPGTIRLHRHYLRHTAGYARSPWRATPAQLTRALAVTSWSPETRKSARGVIVSFYRWATLAGHVEVDPARGLPAVTVPPGQPRPAPEAVLARTLAGADHRTRLMLELAAYAGLRCSEISRVHQLDLVGATLYVHGKGGKTRVVPIGRPDLLTAIATADGWLFPGRTAGHLAPGTVTAILSDALPGKWTGHALRHRFASRAYAGTRDLLAVGAVLGHSRPETTKRYVLMPDDALRAAVDAAA
ncbi:MAG TPA: tyrosine-type recombinase/integrase [Cellulomonadaceae bacterium]|nr:tyrosine-type recombinase/integrase [Cellulomonadaceae bacterium]